MYVGRRKFKKRLWRKVPGTSRRLPTKRPDAEVMKLAVPELRIVDDDLWAAVRARAAAVCARYKQKSRIGSAPGARPPADDEDAQIAYLNVLRRLVPVPRIGAREHDCAEEVRRRLQAARELVGLRLDVFPERLPLLGALPPGWSVFRSPPSSALR